MNDKKNDDFDPSLDMLNPNRSYMEKYPDWAQASGPEKLTEEERQKLRERVKQITRVEPITEEFREKLNQQIDSGVNKEMKEYLDKYMNHDLKQTGLIDTANYPQDIPDKDTCEILDDLLSKNQLQSRVVKYSFIAPNDEAYMTDPFTEYSYDNRKFVRIESKVDQADNITLSNGEKINKGEFHWIEVKPIDYSKAMILNENEEGKRK